jgi:hypothetical protein
MYFVFFFPFQFDLEKDWSISFLSCDVYVVMPAALGRPAQVKSSTKLT